MKIRFVFSVFLTGAVLMVGIFSGRASFVAFEAESGVLGTDFTNGTDGAVQFISISSDLVNSGNPGNANRVATYTVTFPAAGTYNLYARLLVGPGGFSDDSMFYANGFGVESPSADGSWLVVNGLAAGGFTAWSDVVAGSGSAGSQIWKWVNLSQFNPSGSGTEAPITFTVTAGNLTQTFQIGARENGLELDKFVFGTASYSFTVSNLDNGTDGAPPPPPPPPPLSTTTIDSTKTFQTIEGLGGAIAFYNGWVTAHPYKLEIFTNAFAGLNLSMLRLGDWFRYQGTANFDPDAPGFVSNANRLLGHPVPVYMSSWAPPGFLKSNGQVGNGGTLLFTNGGYAYTNFAQYWYDSLQAYGSNGISPTWISIQNEPDWAASYDSCVFHPNEDTVNGTNYASYSKALDAVFQRLTNMPSPPKLLGPECVGIAFNDVQNYAATMHSNSFYGVAHHLYGGSTDGTPDGYNGNLLALTNVFPSKPRFMTEFGLPDMIQQANLIHNVLTVESASGYNYWSLIWPVTQNTDGSMNTDGGLVQIENPFNLSSWTNAPAGTPTQSHGYWLKPAYWAMKHFSYFIQPGYRRVSSTCTDTNVLTSAYVSPDGLRLVAVIINRNVSGPSTNSVAFGSFPYAYSSVYQTAGTNFFQSLGSVGSPLILPVSSLTTVVLDKFVAVGSAANPSPTNGALGVPVNSGLSWTPGNNAVTHAVYLGVDSNAVAQATTASPQFMGILTSNTFCPVLTGGTTNFWRVDEIAGANTNIGAVWLFTTAPTPALVHRYSFSENGGTSVADSAGGPAWTGTLLNNGAFSGGQLVLSSNSQQYVSLPTGIVAPLTNFTIEVWLNLASTANWTRIFDFGNSTTTYMFLTPQNGSTGKLRFSITTSGGGGEQQINGPSALTVGVWNHVAVTLSNNVGILYLNGLAVGTNSAMTLKPSSLGNTVNNYVGRSQFADPYFNGVLDEFRIYNVALSANEIAATDVMGPSQLLSTNSPAMSFATTPVNITLMWDVASAGFTLQSSTNLASGRWINVTSPASQIVNDQWQVTLPPPGNSGSIFYRLAK